MAGARPPPVGGELEPEDKPEQADLESTIQFYFEACREYIATCLDATDLLFYDYFNKDERISFRKKCKAGTGDIVNEILDKIVEMDIANKYTELVNHLEETGYPKIVSVLKGHAIPKGRTRDLFETFLKKNMRFICDNIEIQDVSFCTCLLQQDLITDREVESLRKTCKNSSRVDAGVDLCLMLPNRDSYWLPKFMYCLVRSNQENIAERIDSKLTKVLMAIKDNNDFESYLKSGDALTSLVVIADSRDAHHETRVKEISAGEPRMNELQFHGEGSRPTNAGKNERMSSKQTVEEPKMNYVEVVMNSYDSGAPSNSENNLGANNLDSRTSDRPETSYPPQTSRLETTSLFGGGDISFRSLLDDTENVQESMASSNSSNQSYNGTLSPDWSKSSDFSKENFQVFVNQLDDDLESDLSHLTGARGQDAESGESQTTRVKVLSTDDTGRKEPIGSESSTATNTDLKLVAGGSGNVTGAPEVGYKRGKGMTYIRDNSQNTDDKQMKNKNLPVNNDQARRDVLNITEDSHDDSEVSAPSNAIDEEEDEDISLRDYQIELAAPAIEGKNIIIVAPTGSGKTRVAMRIIQEHIRQLAGHGIAKVIFLVNQVALAYQQGEECRKRFKKYKCHTITGDEQRSKNEYLKDFIDKRDILIVTAQVLLDALVRKEISSINRFSLIVFDECHHTHANHTFNQIMGLYMDLKFSKSRCVLPQIVGLTASVGVGKARNVDKAVDHIKSLMSNLDAHVISTVNKNMSSLREFVSVPDEETHTVPKRGNDQFGIAVTKLMNTLEKRMSSHSLVKEMPEGPKFEPALRAPAEKGNAQYTQWVSKLWKETARLRSAEARKFLNPCRTHLEYYNNALIIYNDARMEDAKQYLHKEMETWRQHAIMDPNEKLIYNAYVKLKEHKFAQCGNPKLEKLRDMVIKAYGTGEKWDNSRGIVFVKTRDLAHAIIRWMKETPGLRELNPIPFLGQSSSSGMTKVEQDDALKYFREGRHKLIVATSVAEEGLDISKCNLVIRYDHVTNEIAMVQSRGRGRASDSKYYLIAEETTGMAEKEELNMIREVMMRKAIIQLQGYIKEYPEKFRKEISVKQDESNLDRQLKSLGKNRKLIRAGQFELHCLRCDSFICFSDTIKKIQAAHHVIVDDTLDQRVTFLERDSSTWQDKSIEFAGKVICKQCGGNLGVICIYKGLEFPSPKIENFLIVDTNARQDTCKKWNQVPFVVESLSMEDLRSIFNARKPLGDQ